MAAHGGEHRAGQITPPSLIAPRGPRMAPLSWSPRRHDGTRRSLAGHAATRAACEGDGRCARVIDPAARPRRPGPPRGDRRGRSQLENVGRSGTARPPQGRAAPRLRVCSGRWSAGVVVVCRQRAAGPPESRRGCPACEGPIHRTLCGVRRRRRRLRPPGQPPGPGSSSPRARCPARRFEPLPQLPFLRASALAIAW